MPGLSADELRSIARERAARVGRYVFGAVVVTLVGAFVSVQWLRPIPAPVFRSAPLASVRLPGTPPSMPWPTMGTAALSVEGVGSLGHSGDTHASPVPGLAQVMTAYVVLQDHPLAPGADGPAIPVTAATLATYQSDVATQQATVPVAAGESLTELESLEGLLVVGGDDVATLLAEWDDGSTGAFVAKMNVTARGLGMDSTTFDDPSGLDPGSVSTPADMIRLGEAALAIPAFRQIVATAQVTLPLAGLVYNTDYDLGQDGIVGIKTGSNAATGGCFLFAAQRTVDGRNVTVVGAVLGQQTVSPTAAAVDDAEPLVSAAFATISTFRAVRSGHFIGQIVAPWGPSTVVTAPKSVTVVGWPGLTVRFHVHVGALPSAISSGARIGVLKVDLGDQDIDLILRAPSRLPGPSTIWRLTRL